LAAEFQRNREGRVFMLDSSGVELGRWTRWLGPALAVTAVGLTACGDTSDSDNDAPARVAKPSEKVVIKTKAKLIEIVDTGTILNGSTLGDSPFCPGGTWSGGHGNLENDWLDKNIKCPDGTLRIAFDPRTRTKRADTDTGPWKIVSGTGAFKGLRGSGRMTIKFGPGDQPTEGHETFTGTVIR
jgi:hypothetical protein